MFDMLWLIDRLGDDCPSPLRIFAHIIRNTNLDYYYYGSYQKIAERTGVSVSTVIRGMKILVEAGLFVHEAPGIWRLNPKYSEIVTGEEIAKMPQEKIYGFCFVPMDNEKCG